MQWIGRALGSAAQYYKDINPATLTGAIDVIVVERRDEHGALELACSPFHVRFGKLSVLRPIDKKVRLEVNGNEAPFFMKVGETGEAFFVFETAGDVPDDMQTSPLAGPVSDDEVAETPIDEPDFFDLNAPRRPSDGSLPSAETAQADDAKTTRPSVGSSADREEEDGRADAFAARHYDTNQKRAEGLGAPAISAGGAVLAAAEKAAALPRAAFSAATTGDQKLEHFEHDHDSDRAPRVSESVPDGESHSTQSDVADGIRAGLEGTHLGEDELSGKQNSVIAASRQLEEATASEHHRRAQESVQPDPNELMLDMAGYKTEFDDVAKNAEQTEEILKQELQRKAGDSAALDDTSAQEMVDLMRALLAAGEGVTDSHSKRHSSSMTSLDGLADSISPEGQVGKVFHARLDDRVFAFELSLCGKDDFGHDPSLDESSFRQRQLTYSQFVEHEDVLEHPALVARCSGKYLTWDNATPVLAALGIYRKALVEREHRTLADSASAGGAEGKRASSSRWSRWWGRSVEVPPSIDTATDPSASPPTSAPSSPRSMPSMPVDIGGVSDNGATEAPAPPAPESDAEPTMHYAKTLRLTSDQLKALNLKSGANTITFSVRSSYSGYATCAARVFLWQNDFQVVISDIDGTITKSDALGHVFTMIGRDWTHLGVAKLYTDISRNGYQIMYLTSRAIGQADITREYLKGINQNGFQLPEGPVIMSPDRLMTSLHREVIMRKPEVFKMACLRDIQRLFGEGRTPFYAGFGNRITDALSYRSVQVPSARIFTIDSTGEVYMELLHLAGYKSSYIHMTDLVDQMFPPVNRKAAPEFTDFNYWRAPISTTFEIPDLSEPASPALSARSGMGSLSRLGSIASTLSRRSSRQTLTEAPAARRARSPTPSSPLLQAVVAEEPETMGGDDEDEDPSEGGSMPGSLTKMLDSDFIRYREQMLGKPSEAEAYKQQVRRSLENDGDEGEGSGEEEDEDDDDDDDLEPEEPFSEELDFSSVPYL